MTTAYVVMVGESPQAVALTLPAAQDNAEQRETRYTGTESRELRWDEYREGEVWRLMSRTGGRGRFAWTRRVVYAVPQTPDGAGGES